MRKIPSSDFTITNINEEKVQSHIQICQSMRKSRINSDSYTEYDETVTNLLEKTNMSGLLVLSTITKYILKHKSLPTDKTDIKTYPVKRIVTIPQKINDTEKSIIIQETDFFDKLTITNTQLYNTLQALKSEPQNTSIHILLYTNLEGEITHLAITNISAHPKSQQISKHAQANNYQQHGYKTPQGYIEQENPPLKLCKVALGTKRAAWLSPTYEYEWELIASDFMYVATTSDKRYFITTHYPTLKEIRNNNNNFPRTDYQWVGDLLGFPKSARDRFPTSTHREWEYQLTNYYLEHEIKPHELIAVFTTEYVPNPDDVENAIENATARLFGTLSASKQQCAFANILKTYAQEIDNTHQAPEYNTFEILEKFYKNNS